MAEPELRSVSVEVGAGGKVLLLLTVSDGLQPAVIGFDYADADRLGKAIRECAHEARAQIVRTK